MTKSTGLIVELSYEDASMCLHDGNDAFKSGYRGAIGDCCASGDASEACEHILDTIGVEFCIVAKDDKGEYENRTPTAQEKQICCEAIYFESETDFSDERTADIYLVWQAANSLAYN